mgnify:FL=1
MSLYETYIASLGPEPSPASRSIASRFCTWLGDRELTRATVLTWMGQRRGAGYSAGSIAREWGVIRRICTTNRLEWPFVRSEAPQVSEGDESRPILPVAAIAAMIRTSLTMEPGVRARLAMATTYGLRRVELQELHPGSFDWAGPTVYVATAKAGRQRYHLLPEELIPVLQASAWRPRSLMYISQEIVQLRLLIGVHAPEVGWHAIRRALARELSQSRNGVEGMSETELTIFLRWKARSMASRYPSGTVIGWGGEKEQHVVGLADQDLDRKAFQLNPWLEVWKECQA